MKITTFTIMTISMQIVLLLSSLNIMAQGNPIVPDIPPSPQAVAFNRLGDYQVNNNYGMPDISIPLFEIDFHGYKIPLALHYEASPLKPGYNYDVTGFGWTLSGNSCVSRTIKDRADEDIFFSNSTPFSLDSFQDHQGNPMMYVDYKDMLNRLNYQYDNYNIVLPSGRNIPFFMYKSDGVMKYDLMSLDSNVKIKCKYSSSGLHSIDSLTVTDEKGVIYYFTIADKTSNGFDNDPNTYKNVTWLLESIDLPGKGSITYEYNDEINIYTQNDIAEPTYRVSRLLSQMVEDWSQKKFDVGLTLQYHSPRYKMRLLKRISYGPTRIDFNYYADNRHMKEIVVSENNETIKKYTLGIYGRFLTSLVFSGTNNEDKLEYGFAYQDLAVNVSDTLVRYTDYWGNICYSDNFRDLGNFNMFFNNEEDGGRLNQQELRNQLAISNIARIIDNKEDDPYYYYKVKLQYAASGDSRQPSPPELHGVLSRITYPNGGYTLFNWENHRFPTATAVDGDFVFDRRSQRIIEGGGFRIKSIKNFAADGTPSNEDHYRYGFTYGDIVQRNFPLPLPDNYDFNDHIGCGEAVVDPNLLTFMTFSYFDYSTNSAPYNNNSIQFYKMTLGQESSFRRFYNIQGRATWWDAYLSADTFRSLIGSRRPVVYPEITVYHGNPDELAGCVSKTVYKYDIYSYTHNPYTYYMSSFNQTTLPDTAYFERIYYYNGAPGMVSDNYQAAKRHQLKCTSEYSYNTSSGIWDLVSEEQYSYNEETLSKGGYVFNSQISRVCRTNYAGLLDNGQWLEDKGLRDFYIGVTHGFGRSTLSERTTTTLRQGGTRTNDNIQTERFSYLYPGVLKSREYSDLYYRIRSDYGRDNCDKKDEYSFVGEESGNSNPVIAEMKSRNMLASLISSETFSYAPWTSKVSGSKMDYSFFGNKILPSKLYESNGDQYEESVEVLSYDAYGNPTEVEDLKTGIHSVFLWDIYGRYLIALVKNATLSQVGNVSQLLSGTSVTRYATLKTLLPNAQIQTWDYKPLIGVSSHTDVNGETTLYEYDGLGRLKAEKRIVNGTAEPEILHEYEYNYLNQLY